MYCPTCQQVVAASDAVADEGRCPVCGGATRPAMSAVVAATENAVVAVEAVPEGCGPCLSSYTIEQEPSRALILRRTTDNAVTVFERVAALPALAWRQPMVRAALKTGASAVTLTLALRAARSWLAQPRRARAVGASLPPALADALGPPRNGSPMRHERRPDEGALVIETFIYTRRVIRR